MTKKERYKKTIEWFIENGFNPKTELVSKNNFQLLVAVILSAQCTDKRVNKITPNLFSAFPTAEAMSTATVEDIYEYIKSCSYPNSKAKHLSEMSRKLVSDFNGEVPDSREGLMTLPGVGRKTANVMLSVAFNMPAMPVDTHVFRVSNRIGLTNNSKSPEETEKTLVENIPNELLSKMHHWLILHGRYICTARKPKCEECGMSEWCKYFRSNKK